MDWSFLAQPVWNLLLAMARRAKTLPANVANHCARARILDAVRHDPGQSLARLCDELRLNRGTAAYHLYILERAGAIGSLSRPHTRHYFPAGLQLGERASLAVLRRERALEVALAILASPGLAQHELLEHIGMDRKVWKAYRSDLTREGLVVEERDGLNVRYRATPKLERLVLSLHRTPTIPGPVGALGGVR